ncbi:MAG: ABC transporter permease [Trueperaceae bacterium]|jgi:peptide/nickel transport system permease protein|nr:ABC transporter permease [Truepera sp.]HRN17751.1 ABC transporter permease [Trueperaceae bacterium]HRQ09451.1 ABC transporter permease [Trueperaceae bacterium]
MRLLKLLERVLSAIPVAIGVAVIAFLFLRFLPGDPVEIMLGDTQVTQQQIDSLRNQLNLDEPLYRQLWLFLTGLVQGDFGMSFVKNQPVVKLIAETLPATIELTIASILFAMLIALPVGIISALREGSWLDRTVLSGALLGVSMPAFWFGLLLILLLSVEAHLLPTSGRISSTLMVDHRTGFLLIDSLLAGDFRAFRDAVSHLILPALTLGVVFSAVLARVVRASMIEALHKDYVTTARAKGLREMAVIVKHALRNALIPALTVAGLQIGELLGGNMIVETVFAWPGMGRLVVSSIFARDYVVVQVAVMLYAFTYVGVNLLVDALYTLLNPRIAL